MAWNVGLESGSRRVQSSITSDSPLMSLSFWGIPCSGILMGGSRAWYGEFSQRD